MLYVLASITRSQSLNPMIFLQGSRKAEHFVCRVVFLILSMPGLISIIVYKKMGTLIIYPIFVFTNNNDQC